MQASLSFLRLSHGGYFAAFLFLLPLIASADLSIDLSKMMVVTAPPPGTTLELEGVDLQNLPPLEYEKTILAGPQYVISDDPEYIRVPEGIAMQEEVLPGRVRLYMYNVNGVKEPEQIPRKIAAVIENLGDEEMSVDVLQSSVPKPSGNYFGVAKQGLREYLSARNGGAPETPRPSFTVPAGGADVLDPRMNEFIANYNDLAHALMEFTIDQPARISIVQTAPEKSAAEAVTEISEPLKSPRKNAGRGLFLTSEYGIELDYDTADREGTLILADGKTDPWVIGRDGTTGEYANLAGNYGVFYNIKINRKSSDGRGLALFVWNARYNPEQWCGGTANAVIVKQGGKSIGEVIELPSDRLNVTAPPQAALIGVFPPVEDGGDEILEITWSPPGASCLPAPLIFLPVDLPEIETPAKH